MTSEYRERIRGSLEENLDSLHYTYSQHFAVANGNRWFGRFTDAGIFSVSSFLLYREVTVGLERYTLILLLFITAGLSALHRATKPGERETRFRESARAHHDLFKRSRKFLQLDLPSDEISNEKVRERHDALLKEHLELNQTTPDASSFWYYWMKYVKGEDRMKEEITTTQTKRDAL